MTPIPLGCTSCDRCSRLSEVYEPYATCRWCASEICPACELSGSRSEDDGASSCLCRDCADAARCLNCGRELASESDRRIEIAPRTYGFPGYEQVGCVQCLPNGARLPSDGPTRDESQADATLSDPKYWSGR